MPSDSKSAACHHNIQMELENIHTYIYTISQPTQTSDIPSGAFENKIKSVAAYFDFVLSDEHIWYLRAFVCLCVCIFYVSQIYPIVY